MLFHFAANAKSVTFYLLNAYINCCFTESIYQSVSIYKICFGFRFIDQIDSILETVFIVSQNFIHLPTHNYIILIVNVKECDDNFCFAAQFAESFKSTLRTVTLLRYLSSTTSLNILFTRTLNLDFLSRLVIITRLNTRWIQHHSLFVFLFVPLNHVKIWGIKLNFTHTKN